MQRSGIDTINYHTWPGTSYGEVTKTQENTTRLIAKRSALSQQVIRRLQGMPNFSDPFKTIIQRYRKSWI